MRIAITNTEGWVVITPRDRSFDVGLVPQFKSLLVDLVDQGQHEIILDLNMVEQVDTAGLGAIVFALRMVERRGSLVLCGISEQFKGLLRMTGLDQVFKTTESIQELLVTDT